MAIIKVFVLRISPFHMVCKFQLQFNHVKIHGGVKFANACIVFLGFVLFYTLS